MQLSQAEPANRAKNDEKEKQKKNPVNNTYIVIPTNAKYQAFPPNIL